MDDNDFRKRLSPEQYRVMREQGTETAYGGQYWDNDGHGIYACAACDQLLFMTSHQVDAGNGYPTFEEPLRAKYVRATPGKTGEDLSCSRCGSHLGFRSADGRHVVNSVALHFIDLGEYFPGWEDLVDTGDSSDEPQKPASSGRVITLGIGSLVVGIVLGAGGATALAPSPVCTPTPPGAATSASRTPAASPTATVRPTVSPTGTPSPKPSPTPSPTPTPSITMPSPTGGLPPASSSSGGTP